jgi:hypothetical protein
MMTFLIITVTVADEKVAKNNTEKSNPVVTHELVANLFFYKLALVKSRGKNGENEEITYPMVFSLT